MKRSKNILIIFLIVFLFISTAFGKENNHLNPSVTLPDGSEFLTWIDETDYSRIYYVDQNHPAASDENTGTKQQPFLTINHAAQVVEPGEKIIILSGVYREKVEPLRGGDGPDKMIAYEAAPGAQVMIKGSRIWKTNWRESRISDLNSRNLWMAKLPDEMFDEYNPFKTQNASEDDIRIMPWAQRFVGQLPYTLGRGLIFQNGRRLVQMAEYTDIRLVPGSFWIDTGKWIAHIYPFDRANPNDILFEITVQQHIFKPRIRGLGYIKVKGLSFEHAGNGLPRTGVGALFTNGGHHWIIEDNIIREVNSVGMEIGARTDEQIREGSREELGAVSGHHIIRKNELDQCGTGGIQGLIVYRCLIEKNHIHHCGWLGVERYWETGGIKILNTKSSVVRKNHIHDLSDAPGIWLDYENVNSRVTQNVIYNIISYHGAIFMEASQVPNWVDNNFIWNCNEYGVYQHDCDELLIANNIVGQCKNSAICMGVNKNRRVGGRLATSKHNKVISNVLIDNDTPFKFVDYENSSDENVISGIWNDRDEWRRRGLDKNSVYMDIDASFDSETLEFTWTADKPFPKVDWIEDFSYDLFGSYSPAEGDAAVPGAIQSGIRSDSTTYQMDGVW